MQKPGPGSPKPTVLRLQSAYAPPLGFRLLVSTVKVFGFCGAGIGIGNVFGSLITAGARNPTKPYF